MIFMLKIRNNKDLLILKVYGYSNLKYFYLALTSFIFGWMVLFVAALSIFNGEILKKQNAICKRY